MQLISYRLTSANKLIKIKCWSHLIMSTKLLSGNGTNNSASASSRFKLAVKLRFHFRSLSAIWTLIQSSLLEGKSTNSTIWTNNTHSNALIKVFPDERKTKLTRFLPTLFAIPGCMTVNLSFALTSVKFCYSNLRASTKTYKFLTLRKVPFKSIRLSPLQSVSRREPSKMVKLQHRNMAL